MSIPGSNIIAMAIGAVVARYLERTRHHPPQLTTSTIVSPKATMPAASAHRGHHRRIVRWWPHIRAVSLSSVLITWQPTDSAKRPTASAYARLDEISFSNGGLTAITAILDRYRFGTWCHGTRYRYGISTAPSEGYSSVVELQRRNWETAAPFRWRLVHSAPCRTEARTLHRDPASPNHRHTTVSGPEGQPWASAPSLTVRSAREFVSTARPTLASLGRQAQPTPPTPRFSGSCDTAAQCVLCPWAHRAVPVSVEPPSPGTCRRWTHPSCFRPPPATPGSARLSHHLAGAPPHRDERGKDVRRTRTALERHRL